jgi:hypothetical protein
MARSVLKNSDGFVIRREWSVKRFCRAHNSKRNVKWELSETLFFAWNFKIPVCHATLCWLVHFGVKKKPGSENFAINFMLFFLLLSFLVPSESIEKTREKCAFLSPNIHTTGKRKENLLFAKRIAATIKKNIKQRFNKLSTSNGFSQFLLVAFILLGIFEVQFMQWEWNEITWNQPEIDDWFFWWIKILRRFFELHEPFEIITICDFYKRYDKPLTKVSFENKFLIRKVWT